MDKIQNVKKIVRKSIIFVRNHLQTHKPCKRTISNEDLINDRKRDKFPISLYPMENQDTKIYTVFPFEYSNLEHVK